MASQFDELRLQVSLVDNATAQLKSIKSSLDELGTGSQANNLDRLKRETGEVDAALRKMVDTALRGPKAFLDLARSVTVAGVSLGTFAYAAEKTLGTVGALSSKLVELLHISRQTGFDPAVIKQITQAYERSGLSARQAQQEMAGFSSSLADFAQINSKVRQGIEAGFGNQKELIGQFRQMYDAIDRAPDTISKFNTIKDHANAIFEQFKGQGPGATRQDHPRPDSRSVQNPRRAQRHRCDQAGDGCDVGASEKADRISGGIRKGHDQDFPELDRHREHDEVRRDE